jgi:hypothetical protein
MAFKVHFEDVFIIFFNYLKKILKFSGHKLFLYPIQIKKKDNQQLSGETTIFILTIYKPIGQITSEYYNFCEYKNKIKN